MTDDALSLVISEMFRNLEELSDGIALVLLGILKRLSEETNYSLVDGLDACRAARKIAERRHGESSVAIKWIARLERDLRLLETNEQPN